MCGIYGFVTNESQYGDQARVGFCQDAAIAGTARGMDGAGAILAYADAKHGVDVIKTGGAGWDLVAHKSWAEDFVANSHKLRAFIGHNRAATTGNVSHANAHPFNEGPITMVHNGTLRDMKALPTQAGKKRKDIEVDSHLLALNLSKHPVEDVIRQTDGAYALVWHDMRDNSINFIRNAERPLYFLSIKGQATMLFASEPDMLWWIAGRRRFNRGGIYSLAPLTHMKIAGAEGKPVLRKLEEYKYVWTPPATGHTYGTGATYYPPPHSAPRDTTHQLTLPAPAKEGSKRNESKRLPKINGRNRAAMVEAGIPIQPLSFTVAKALRRPGSNLNMVNGLVYWETNGKPQSCQALITDATDSDLVRGAQMDWMVLPMGIRPLGDGMMLMVKTVLFQPHKAGTVTDHRDYEGPNRTRLTKKEWLAMTKTGCHACGSPLHPHQHEHVFWAGANTAICPDCFDEQTKPQVERQTH